MNQKILETLEFQKVKNLVEPYLQTEQGEVELQELAPLTKKEAIETAFLEMADMAQIFVEHPHFSVPTIQEIRPVTKRLELETSLNIDELLAVKKVLRVTHELRNFYDELENVRLEKLDRIFENLVDLPQLQGSLHAINEAGFIENFASETLAKIRRRIQENEHQVRDILQELLKTKSEMLADQIIASRNGRNVLPVWCMIFQLVEIPSISNLERSSISMKKLLTIVRMNASRCFGYWKKFQTFFVLMRGKSGTMLG